MDLQRRPAVIFTLWGQDLKEKARPENALLSGNHAKERCSFIVVHASVCEEQQE